MAFWNCARHARKAGRPFWFAGSPLLSLSAPDMLPRTVARKENLFRRRSASVSEDPGTPGQRLFPEYSQLAGMYRNEVEGLTESQLDRRRPEKSWGLWSVRDQVSHMAMVNYRWFLGNWGPTLFGDEWPRDKSLADTGGADRKMDPERFHAMADLLDALEDGLSLAWEILEKETLASLREKALSCRVPRDYRWPSGDAMRDWTENISLKAHPGRYWRDEKDPDLFHYNLEYTFRHVSWEAYAHLKTIQKHKEAEGLPPAGVIPDEGYLRLLTWE